MSLRIEHESLVIPFQGIVVLLNLLVLYFFLTILTMQLVLLFILEECYVVLVNLDIDIDALMNLLQGISCSLNLLMQMTLQVLLTM